MNQISLDLGGHLANSALNRQDQVGSLNRGEINCMCLNCELGSREWGRSVAT